MSAVVVALSAACASDAGDGFTRLGEANLRAELSGVGSDALTTDRGYRVQLSVAAVEAGELQLLQTGQAPEPADTDPGHDHGSVHEDEEDEDENSSEPVERPLVTWNTVVVLDALSGEPVPLQEPEPSAELPLAEIVAARVHLEQLELRGDIEPSGDSADATPLELRVELPLELTLEQPFELTIDEDAPERLRIAAELALDPTLLDGLDLAQLASDGIVRITDPQSGSGLALLQALEDSRLSVEAR